MKKYPYHNVQCGGKQYYGMNLYLISILKCVDKYKFEGYSRKLLTMAIFKGY